MSIGRRHSCDSAAPARASRLQEVVLPSPSKRRLPRSARPGQQRATCPAARAEGNPSLFVHGSLEEKRAKGEIGSRAAEERVQGFEQQIVLLEESHCAAVEENSQQLTELPVLGIECLSDVCGDIIPADRMGEILVRLLPDSPDQALLQTGDLGRELGERKARGARRRSAVRRNDFVLGPCLGIGRSKAMAMYDSPISKGSFPAAGLSMSCAESRRIG